MTDPVVALYQALVEELRRRGHSLTRSVTVAELYQDLVPYRKVRSRLGVELNADYEHAMLRLLAGEHDLLRLEPEEAREELRQEASAAYPAVGLFRKFSASRVWVATPEAGVAATSESEPPPPAAAPDTGSRPAHGSCPACGGALPGRPIRFCPHCGEDQAGRCPSCGAAVEARWRYCVQCGGSLGRTG